MVEETFSQQRNSKGQYLKGFGRWKPGQSGNPGGRVRDPGITPVQIEMLDMVCPYDAEGRTWREFLALKGLLRALEKEMASENLKDRLEGKVSDKIEVAATQTITTIIKDYGKE